MVRVLCVQVKITQEKFKLITIYLESNDNSVIEIERERLSLIRNMPLKKRQVRQRTKYIMARMVFP